MPKAREGGVYERGYPPLVGGGTGGLPGKKLKSTLQEVASEAFLSISKLYLSYILISVFTLNNLRKIKISRGKFMSPEFIQQTVVFFLYNDYDLIMMFL